MRTALVLSPHFDDAAFSCGGLMAQLADAGWRVVMATAFTRPIHPAHGFALACQLDKGLPPETDYMALRRTEDIAAARILGAEPLCLDLPEAPHRGYESAPALFGPMRDDDPAADTLAPLLQGLVNDVQPQIVLAPQGLGNHIDHRQMIRAISRTIPTAPLAFYRDTPYAIRNPLALPFVTRTDLEQVVVAIPDGLDRKIAASCAYASQIGFQFGGADPCAAALREFAGAEGQGTPGERYLTTAAAKPVLLHP